jgi:hypothetical protein
MPSTTLLSYFSSFSYMKHSNQIPPRGKIVQVNKPSAFYNIASPRRKLRDDTMCPSIHNSLILRPKLVKPAVDGFKTQTTKLSMPSFDRGPTSKPSNGFEAQTIKLSISVFKDQTDKPSCMPHQA